MEQKFPVIVQTFWYASHGCPEIEENEAGNGIEVRKIVSSIKQNLQILIYFLDYCATLKEATSQITCFLEQ